MCYANDTKAWPPLPSELYRAKLKTRISIQVTLNVIYKRTYSDRGSTAFSIVLSDRNPSLICETELYDSSQTR